MSYNGKKGCIGKICAKGCEGKMKHVFIVNPVSGQADASGTLVPRIIAAAAGLGVEYSIELTQYHRHAVELARKAAETAGGPVRLYACGGDGTFGQVLQGAWQVPGAEVACVPCGSGNDFIRNYGTRQDFLDLPALISGSAVPIDLIQTPFGVSAAICSAGLDAQVAYGIPKFRRVPLCGGSMAYNLSILECLCGHLSHHLRIEIDGRMWEEHCLLAAICNGSTYGGGYCAAPEAVLDDGLLDILVVRRISRLKIARVLGIYQKGRHIQDGRVVPGLEGIILYCRARSVRITPLDGRPLVVNLDGECAPQAGLEAHVLPLAGRIVLPRPLAQKALAQKGAAAAGCQG